MAKLRLRQEAIDDLLDVWVTLQKLGRKLKLTSTMERLKTTCKEFDDLKKL